MTLGEMIRGSLSSWVKEEGPDQDIVLSSRIRLARNLSGMPFPPFSKEEQLKEVIKSVSKAIHDGGGWGLELKELPEISPLERQTLVEKHLVSPDFIKEPRGRALIINPQENVCVMVNEEDHLRIQTILPGLQLEEALNLANGVDDSLEANLDYAFHESVGYLTACPTNAGTGMRASVMVHLPALRVTDQLGRVLQEVAQIGLAVRGLFGEGSVSTGSIVQISNQVTLGLKEEEMLGSLVGVVRQVMEHERAARAALLQGAGTRLEDRVRRAFGILKEARLLTTKEATEWLSDVRLGMDTGLIQELEPSVFNELLVVIQPGFLQKVMGRDMDSFQRDEARALLVRERFK